MIQLSNGYVFNYVASSGSLGFAGRGWFWERPLVWSGHIDPHKFLVITKTLTRYPRKGNLRWWCPWRCVKLLPNNDVVSAVALTNPGIDNWIKSYHPQVVKHKIDIAVSIAPDSIEEAIYMTQMCIGVNSMQDYWNDQQYIKAIELNMSCPNAERPNEIVEYVEAIKSVSNIPIIVKLGLHQEHVWESLEGKVDAVDLINCPSWDTVFNPKLTLLGTYNPYIPSPLAHLGGGGVSGHSIAPLALEALKRFVAKVKIPVISGGGITSLEVVKERIKYGADAVAFGSMFLRHPTLPNTIIRQLEGESWDF